MARSQAERCALKGGDSCSTCRAIGRPIHGPFVGFQIASEPTLDLRTWSRAGTAGQWAKTVDPDGRRFRQDRCATIQTRRSVPSAMIGQASPAVARARRGFASEGRRRGSPAGRRRRERQKGHLAGVRWKLVIGRYEDLSKPRPSSAVGEKPSLARNLDVLHL